MHDAGAAVGFVVNLLARGVGGESVGADEGRRVVPGVRWSVLGYERREAASSLAAWGHAAHRATPESVAAKGAHLPKGLRLTPLTMLIIPRGGREVQAAIHKLQAASRATERRGRQRGFGVVPCVSVAEEALHHAGMEK